MANATKKKKRLSSGQKVISTEFVYARVIGIMATSMENISIETLFAYELAPHPTALFDDNGDIRKARRTSKIK